MWREEDPRRRNNFTLGLHAEISVCMVPKKRRFETELKMASDKNKNGIWPPLLSLLPISNGLYKGSTPSNRGLAKDFWIGINGRRATSF